jgi:hypothetical protein
VKVSKAERIKAGERLKLRKKPDGPTPPRRVSWALGVENPMTDEEVSPADLRRLAKYARYRASEKGRARTARYKAGPACEIARHREGMKRLRASIARNRALVAQMSAELGVSPEATTAEVLDKILSDAVAAAQAP